MVSSDKNGTSLRLFFDGKIDRETEDVFQRIVTWELEDVSELCIDMDGIDEIYGSVVRILVFAESTMQKRGTFSIINANESVREVCKKRGIGGIIA